MASFTTSDLLYSNYSYTAHPKDDPRLTGKPDSTLLNRGEAYEMVYFINRYMTSKGWTYKSTFQGIETSLKTSTNKDKSHKFWREYLEINFTA